MSARQALNDFLDDFNENGLFPIKMHDPNKDTTCAHYEHHGMEHLNVPSIQFRYHSFITPAYVIGNKLNPETGVPYIDDSEVITSLYAARFSGMGEPTKAVFARPGDELSAYDIKSFINVIYQHYIKVG